MFRSATFLALAAKAPQCMHCGAYNHGQVVAAHRNEGKGMGLKCPDFMWSALCDRCHMEYDQGRDMSREDRRAMWLAAYWLTQDWLWTSGHLIVSVVPEMPDPGPPKPKAKIAKGPKLQGRKFDKPATPRKIPGRGFQKRTKT